jgi:hypothetical protein
MLLSISGRLFMRREAGFLHILTLEGREAEKGAEKRLRFKDKPDNFKKLPRTGSGAGTGEATMKEGRA